MKRGMMGEGGRNTYRSSFCQMLLIAMCGAAVYSNTFHVPFVLDDFHVIAENYRLDDLNTFISSGQLSDPRWFSLATFALNKGFGGLDVSGYHVVNLLIHLAAGIVVYLLAKTTIAGFGEEAFQKYRYTPFVASLGFVLHPIHTESVTYIVQRMTSLATLLYLVAVLLYAKAYGERRGDATSSVARRRIFAAASFLSAVLAMGSKEIAYTLPIMLMFYDICFLDGTFRERFRRLAPIFLVAISLFLALIGADRVLDVIAHGGGDLSGRPLSRSGFIITELCVITTYLRLLILPVNQNLDYDYPAFTSLLHIRPAASLLLTAVLLSGALWLLSRSFQCRDTSTPLLRITGFAVIWFYVTISLESGAVPLLDTIFEHRVYLPSAWLFTAIGMMISEVCLRRPVYTSRVVIAVFIVLAGYGYATYQRNGIWKDEAMLWSDVVVKSPGKARGWANLGIVFVKRGDAERATPLLERATVLNPDYYLAHAWLGQALILVGQQGRALGHFQTVTRLAPEFPQGWEMAGRLLLESNRPREAVHCLMRARGIDPAGFRSDGYLQRARFLIEREHTGRIDGSR